MTKKIYISRKDFPFFFQKKSFQWSMILCQESNDVDGTQILNECYFRLNRIDRLTAELLIHCFKYSYLLFPIKVLIIHYNKHCTKNVIIKNLLSTCDQIRRKLRILSHLLKQFLMDFLDDTGYWVNL